MATLRWYSHARIKRYGRTLYVNSPRVWKWGLSIVIFTASTFGLGLVCFRDNEDDEWVALVCLGIFEFRFTSCRYHTKREHRDHVDKFAAEHGERIAAEAEAFLRGD